MLEFAGKTAFVTGRAGGIGLALGRSFAEAGMKVMLADIETEALAVAVESLHAFGPNVRGVACDVADAASVERAAEASHIRKCAAKWTSGLPPSRRPWTGRPPANPNQGIQAGA